jgi:hypothetical protein
METANKILRAVNVQTRAIKLFYCYAHKDEKFKDELEKHLVILKRQGQISDWSHRKIEPGTNRVQSIDAHLNVADIILLLISPDFLTSDYCYDIGMQQAIERHEAGEARVIPIILRPVEWEKAPFSQLQVLPEEGKPVTLWGNRDSAFCSIARGIRCVIEAHQFQEKGEQIRGQESRYISHKSTTTAETNTYPYPTEISDKVINTKEAIHLIYRFLQADNEKRIFLITGNTCMGKSHLLNQVFRPLAHNVYGMHCIMLDLRNPAHTILDLLCMIRNQCDDCILDENTWRAFFSKDRLPRNNSLLTSYVAKELKGLDKPVLFLIDSVEGAKKTTSAWLTEILLPTLISSLSQVRIVMTGRCLPQVHGRYVELCTPQPPSPPYQLGSVEDEEAYIDYCEHLNVNLVEQSIRDLAYACDYTPGIFATLIHKKFRSRRV